MEIKDIVVDADMDVRGGATAVNAIGGFTFVQNAAQNNGGWGSQSTKTGQSLVQEGAFVPQVSQNAAATSSYTTSFDLGIDGLNVMAGWGGRRRALLAE